MRKEEITLKLEPYVQKGSRDFNFAYDRARRTLH